MGMATRLSTAANKKNAENVALEDFELPASGDEHDEVFGNICLVQYQAITSGLFVGILSCVLGGLVHKTVNSWSEIMLILASSTMTSFISSLLTGGLLSFIIVRSRRAHINPDNISTPLANCFGDLSTIIVLAWLSRMLFSINSTFLSTSLLVGSIGLGCVWVVLTLRNKTVRPLFWSCWPPVIYSILIASVAGLAFERFIGRFEGLGLVLTVANGICGNAGSILAARHTTSLQLEMANDKKKNRAARCSLFLLCTPIHFVYLASIQACHLGHASNTWSYIIVNMLASHFQLFGILWVAPRLVKAIWQRGLDPDNYTMPLLAAINDLVGTLIFIGAFSILALMNK